VHPPRSFPVSLHWQPVPVLKNSFILLSTGLKLQEDPEDGIENSAKQFDEKCAKPITVFTSQREIYEDSTAVMLIPVCPT
jgi:hypothetical protein